MSTKKLTIVGRGPAGSAAIYWFYLNIVKTGDSNWTLVTIDKEGVGCGGPAFSLTNTCDEDMLCNMPAGTMAITNDPSDFVNWLIDNDRMPPLAVPNAFYASRRDYGQYLSDRTSQWLKLLKKCGVSINVVESEVLDIARIAPEWKIMFSEGAAITSDYLVMATGGFASNALNYLIGADQAIPHAYPFSQLDQIPHDQSVGIIGSSLTFIDAVTKLDSQGHSGRVFVTSSNCVFSTIRPLYDSDHKVHHSSPEQLRAHCLRWGRDLTVDIVLSAFERDCEDAGVPLEDVNFLREQNFRGQKVLINRLQSQLATPCMYSARFSVLSAMANGMPEIWQMLSESEKARWKEIERWYAAAAFPCPPSNGKKLKDWLSSGRVIVQGKVTRENKKHPKGPPIKAKKEGFDIRYDHGLTQHVDWIINATGLSYDLTSDTAPGLHKSLSERKILTPNGRLGILVDFDTCSVIDHNNLRQPGLYVVGPLTRGVHYYTNSVSMNSLSAKRAITDIIYGNAFPHDNPLQMEAA